MTVRVPPEQLARIDAWREAQPKTADEEPSRPDAIRALVDKGLEGS